MRRTPFPVIGLVAGLGLFLAACGGKEAGPPPAPEVGTITLAPERTEIATELPGRTSPFEVAEIRPQVSGIIVKRLFTEGGHVRQGQQLYQIDPAPYQAALDEAEATLARARANLTATATRARRIAALAKENAASAQEAEDTAAALGQAKADVAAGEAAVERARINLGYTRLSAPITGRIGRSLVTVGALVNANQTEPLAVVQRLDPIYVDVTQSSNIMLQLRAAMEQGKLATDRDASAAVRLTLQDGTEYPLAGRLQFAEVTVDPSTGSVVMRARFPNPHEVLLPGMYVRTHLVEAVAPQAILAPQKAIGRDTRGRATAFVVTKDNKVELRQVTVTQAVANRWIVADGLKAGDRLIVDGLQRIRPGMDVRPVAAGANASGPAAAKGAPAEKAAGAARTRPAEG